MTIQRADFIEVLKDSYSAYYNINPAEDQAELPLAFRADYFSRAERYWLTKSIPMWGNETNEYAYIFSAPGFTRELAERCMDFALEDGLPRVKPHKEHQYTNIKVILVADELCEEAKKSGLQKELFQKLQVFSLRLLHAAYRGGGSEREKGLYQPGGARSRQIFQKAFCGKRGIILLQMLIKLYFLLRSEKCERNSYSHYRDCCACSGLHILW